MKGIEWTRCCTRIALVSCRRIGDVLAKKHVVQPIFSHQSWFIFFSLFASLLFDLLICFTQRSLSLIHQVTHEGPGAFFWPPPAFFWPPCDCCCCPPAACLYGCCYPPFRWTAALSVSIWAKSKSLSMISLFKASMTLASSLLAKAGVDMVAMRMALTKIVREIIWLKVFLKVYIINEIRSEAGHSFLDQSNQFNSDLD